MIRIATITACALLLGGCRIWAAGDDPAGRELRGNAKVVLEAANRYVQANGKPPADLGALVPDYLAALPAKPVLNYSPVRGTLVYNYDTMWPPNSVSACQAKLGEHGFRCIVYN
jgi:hypothetical protein